MAGRRYGDSRLPGRDAVRAEVQRGRPRRVVEAGFLPAGDFRVLRLGGCTSVDDQGIAAGEVDAQPADEPGRPVDVVGRERDDVRPRYELTGHVLLSRLGPVAGRRDLGAVDIGDDLVVGGRGERRGRNGPIARHVEVEPEIPRAGDARALCRAALGIPNPVVADEVRGQVLRRWSDPLGRPPVRSVEERGLEPIRWTPSGGQTLTVPNPDLPVVPGARGEGGTGVGNVRGLAGSHFPGIPDVTSGLGEK